MERLGSLKKACVILLVCMATAIAASAQAFTSLFSFDGTNGDAPNGLVQSTDGNIYGTTRYGGAHNWGTFFKMTPEGALTTLYNFCSQALCSDGRSPNSGLIQGSDGNFYGTTIGGGTFDGGTFFKITPEGTLTTLYSFCAAQGNCPNPSEPMAGVIQAADGNFYGTTAYGGAYDDGTVFKVTPGGTLTVLHSFDGTDGTYSTARLIQTTDGNFYGTTQLGGGITSSGYGTVFKITPDGMLTTLYRFDTTGGVYPQAGLVQATDGNFYGTTLGTGLGGGYGQGTVFKITPGGHADHPSQLLHPSGLR